MWNWIKKVFVGNPIDLLIKLIPNPLVAMLVRKALELAAAQAVPFVIKAGDWIVKGTLWDQDDAYMVQLKADHPSLFAGPHTAADAKLVAMLYVRAVLLGLADNMTVAGAGIATETAVAMAAAEGAITTASAPPVVPVE